METIRESNRLSPVTWTTAGITAIATAITLVGDRPLVDAVVVVGLGLIAPLALGGARPWAWAALAAALALRPEPGLVPTLLVLPALVVAGWSVLDHLRRAGARGLRSLVDLTRSLDAVSYVLAPIWAGVAVVSLCASVADVSLFGIGEPIVRLTAVHYLYAGMGALTIARRLRLESAPGARLPLLAVVATAVAPPIVAAGFVLGHPVPQIGGAVLMTVGVWSSAVVLLASVRRSTDTVDRLLRTTAGLTPWAPMVLAVAWATAQHVGGVPALSVPDMARIHGLANGVGFVLLGLLATAGTAETRAERSSARATA